MRNFIVSRLDDKGAEILQACSEEARTVVAEHDVAIREFASDQFRELIDGVTADVNKAAADSKRELESMLENAVSEVRVSQDDAFTKLKQAQEASLEDAKKTVAENQRLTLSHLSIIDKLVRTQTARLDDITPRMTAIKVNYFVIYLFHIVCIIYLLNFRAIHARSRI